MTSGRTYKPEELNNFKLIDIIQTGCKGLRVIFTDEWYWNRASTWNDTKHDREALYNSMLSTNPSSKDLEKFRYTRIADWDCTMLCSAILSLHPPYEMSRAIFALKKIRNDFAHNPTLKLSSRDLHSKAETIADNFERIGFPEIARKVRFIVKQKLFSKKETSLENDNHVKICNLPLPPSHVFTYRKHEVEDVTNRLGQLRISNEDDGAVSIVYIYGNAGCGKTQVARQFGLKHYKSKAATVVWTLNAEDTTTMVDSLGKLASDLGCDEEKVSNAMQVLDEEKSKKSLKILSNLVRARLKYRPWLLIVENITKSSTFKEYWPQPGDLTWGRGQVVVTTQDARTVPRKNRFTDSLCLSKGMNKKDAEHLLLTVSNLQTEDLTEVVDALNGQPLALASAAVYVKESGVSWKEYMTKLKDGKNEYTDELYLETSSGNYGKTMTNAVMMFSRYMWEDDPVLKKAFTFLGFCAVEQPVPLELIVQYVTQCDSQLDDGVVRGKLKSCTHLLLDDIRGETVDKLILRHQVVQRSFERLVKESLSESSSQLSVLSGILMAFQIYYKPLDKAWDTSSVMKKKLCFQHLTKIADSIATKSEEFLELEKNIVVEDCLEELGHFCLNYDKLKPSRIFYELSLKMREKAYGKTHLKVALIKSKLAKCLLHLGSGDEAEECCSDALTILKGLREENSEDVDVSIAQVLTTLGLVQEKKGNLTESKASLTEALEILDLHPKCDPEIKALAFTSLGTILYRLGDFHGSYDNLQKALHIRRNQNNPKLSQSLCNVGFVASEIGKAEEGEKYLEEAFTIAASKYDNDNDILGYIYCNKGIVCRRLGKLDEAKQYSLEARETFQRIAQSPADIAESTDYLGMVYYERQEYADAKECHEEAIQIWNMENGGKVHPKLGRFERNLGTVLEATGELDSALMHYTFSLKIMETCGDYHPEVAMVLERIASVQNKRGNTVEASNAKKRALQIRMKQTGEFSLIY